MRALRIALVSLALLPACGRSCARDVPKQAIPITPEKVAVASADASLDAPLDAPKTLPFPTEWHGTYAIAESLPTGKGSVLKLRVVGTSTTAPRDVVTSPTDPIAQVAFAPDGASLAYVTTQTGETGAQEQTLHSIALNETSPRPLAKCGYACSLLGLGADGEVWYLDSPNSSLISSVKHVSNKGGAHIVWPHWFADCALSGVVARDGLSLLLGVDNALGWPDCIKGGYQGFYVVPLADAKQRDRMPVRTACFTKQGPKEINLGIQHLAFDPANPDRIVFVANDGWETDAAVDWSMPWSCKQDGTDPQRLKHLPPFLDRRNFDGSDWLVAATAAEGTGEEPIRLLGPFESMTAFARHFAAP